MTTLYLLSVLIRSTHTYRHTTIVTHHTEAITECQFNMDHFILSEIWILINVGFFIFIYSRDIKTEMTILVYVISSTRCNIIF